MLFRSRSSPPVGSAAYAGGELRGHAPKAQTGEKSNINARGCASGNAAKAGTPHRKFLPLPHSAPGKGIKPFPGGSGAPASRPASCPSSPARSAAWRQGCRKSPGSRSLPSCWSPVGSANNAFPLYSGRFSFACPRTVLTRLHVYGSPSVTSFLLITALDCCLALRTNDQSLSVHIEHFAFPVIFTF